MVTSLFKHERIKTTKVRAREVRRYAEKMITTAKKETLAAKRQVFGFVRERDVVNKLFKTLIYRYAERKGGYTRVLKLGNRAGDNAEMVFLELVDRPIEEKNVESTDSKKEKKEKNTTPEVKDQVEGKKKSKEVSVTSK